MRVEKVKKDIHGIVPVMITPFHEDGDIDWGGLENLIEWYIAHGAQALFAVCQSSEMQFLSLAERRDLAIFTAKSIAVSRLSPLASLCKRLASGSLLCPDYSNDARPNSSVPCSGQGVSTGPARRRVPACEIPRSCYLAAAARPYLTRRTAMDRCEAAREESI